jgi:HK97 family phage major capsid protein
MADKSTRWSNPEQGAADIAAAREDDRRRRARDRQREAAAEYERDLEYRERQRRIGRRAAALVDASPYHLNADDALRQAAAQERQAERERRGASGAAVISEPGIYRPDGTRSFFRDLAAAALTKHPESRMMINMHDKHARLNAQKRGVVTSTLGGILVPQYLVAQYARASRTGRIYADQASHAVPLPAEGLSAIFPRLTTGTTAGVQALESTALSTQDVVESDHTVPVRTIGGTLPVSRQALDRQRYSDQVLYEDLVARYAVSLDTQCISGSGSSGQIQGVLGTSGIVTATAGTATAAGIWPKIADVVQQINAAVDGLGYLATKIFMHPRRWGAFTAALDSQNRPWIEPDTDAADEVHGAGFVAVAFGCRVYVDPNIPTNLGAGTNEDRIIVECHSLVNLLERGDGAPITVGIEQQAGTSMQVQLVAYGYVAFTAGRYPAASGVVSGAGLATPTF